MSETTQLPGNLPPGATVDSLLTVGEFAVWTGLSEVTVRDQIRRGRLKVIATQQPRRIHPRSYLLSRSPELRKVMRGAV